MDALVSENGVLNANGLMKTNKRTSGTKEWADYNVNCFKGCHNNCRYCYAKMMAKRFGRSTDSSWKTMHVRKDIMNKTFRKFNGRVMFPSSHDIIDDPKVKQVCFNVIEKLVEANNEILITTKPSFNVTKEIMDRFEEFKEQIQFRFTITSNNDKLLAFWESNAPLYEERLKSLKYAFKNDFKTSVSMEPFLDYQPQELVRIISPFITESIWIGPMNYMARNNINKKDIAQFEETRKNYEIENLARIYEDLKNIPSIRFKDSMMIRLKLPIKNTC
jgi:DNA repair photolyase